MNTGPDTSLQALFGTEEPPSALQTITLGRLSFLRSGGTVRSLCWDGVEVLRGLDCVVRDDSWGTCFPVNINELLDGDAEAGEFHLRRTFSIADNALTGLLDITAAANGRLDATLEIKANRDLLTNRAGFTVLHPVAGVVGSELAVTHSDGSTEDQHFPLSIAASQPVFDIAGLSYEVNGVVVEISFTGDVFEMEDQRNWSDASYKTYCRPLGLPFPYVIAAGTTVHQSVAVRVSGAREAVAEHKSAQRSVKRDSANVSKTWPMPDILLAVEPPWLGKPSDADLPPNTDLLKQTGATGLLLRMGCGHEWQNDELAKVAALLSATEALLSSNEPGIDVEIVVPGNADLDRFLGELAEQLNDCGLSPKHVVALPEPYLKSYQPAGPWPQGHTPADCIGPARKAFPAAKIGAGVLTNFTELNRLKLPAAAGDYVTHGSTAIVHAADDRSVFETLEALPQIFQSAQKLAGNRQYRLGLVSIGMRSNPYGAAVVANPHNLRLPMAMHDPRQKGLFNAAWVIAVALTAAQNGVAAMAAGAPAGPFGITEPGSSQKLYPVFHAISALAALSGNTVALMRGLPANVYGLSSNGRYIVSNCNLAAATVELPVDTGVCILNSVSVGEAGNDPRWLFRSTTLRGRTFELEPCSCLFAGFGERA